MTSPSQLDPTPPSPVRTPERLSAPDRTKRALMLLGLTLVLPGAAQVVAGDRRLGRLALRVTLTVWALLVLGVLLALFFNRPLLWLASNTVVQLVAVVVLAALAVGWLILWVDTFRIIHWNLLAPGMKRVVGALTVGLMLLTGGVLGYGSYAVNTARNSLGTIFAVRPAIDPVDGRYNFLVMGGDAGEGREGLRPDSIHVASIDAASGQVVMFSIPRNMQNAPFTEDSPLWQVYPDGYSCGDACIINALYMDVTNQHAGLYPGAADPGAEAMKDAAGGILGLEIQGYALVDMDGFAQLIDAMGGVSVTTGGYTPYRGVRPDGQWGNVWWAPGEYTFNGADALGYARSRLHTNDYARIARQQCVQSAMLAQFNPQTLLTRFEGIMRAGEQIVETDLPGQQLGTFVSLAAQSRSHPMERMTIGPPDFEGDRFTTFPDYELIHSRVDQKLAESAQAAASAGPYGPQALPLLTRFAQLPAASTPSATPGTPQSEWPAPPTQPDGSPITPEYLQWAEDTGQVGLLEQAAATNHLCAPGR